MDQGATRLGGYSSVYVDTSKIWKSKLLEDEESIIGGIEGNTSEEKTFNILSAKCYAQH